MNNSEYRARLFSFTNVFMFVYICPIENHEKKVWALHLPDFGGVNKRTSGGGDGKGARKTHYS